MTAMEFHGREECSMREQYCKIFKKIQKVMSPHSLKKLLLFIKNRETLSIWKQNNILKNYNCIIQITVFLKFQTHFYKTKFQIWKTEVKIIRDRNIMIKGIRLLDTLKWSKLKNNLTMKTKNNFGTNIEIWK
jgi:hypothetical protein